jgi:uncharacterized protein (TIGR02231 family)
MRLLLTLLYILLAIWALSSPLFAQTERPVAQRLDAVKVYRDRAQLTHSGSADVAVGQTQLVFSGVSPSLDAASLQVSGQATTGTGLTILSVASRTSYLAVSKRSDRIERLRDSLKLTNRAITAQADLAFVVQSEEKLLLDNIKVAGSNAGLSIATLDQLAERYRTRLGALRMQLRTTEQRREELNLELHRITNELASIEGQPSIGIPQVVVTVEAKAAGRATLKLVYLASGAGWSPEYDLRLDKIGEPLTLDIRAQVVNNTGVAWNSIPLTLTTASANVSAQAPMLTPNYLRELVVSYPSRQSAKDSGSEPKALSNRDFTAAIQFRTPGIMVTEDVGSAADLSTASQGALALDYDIAAKYDIPADGQPRQVAVARHSLPAEVIHFAVPKLDGDAFLLARVRGFDGLGLLAGPASVYLEGAFVARTQFDPDQTEDTLRVGLGRDARVQIKRQAIRELASRKVFGGAVRLQRGYSIELRNARADVVTLVLEDQVPVTQDERIKVKLLERDGAEFDPATGKLTWRLSLKPGERRTLRFSYEIEHPRALPVQGL